LRDKIAGVTLVLEMFSTDNILLSGCTSCHRTNSIKSLALTRKIARLPQGLMFSWTTVGVLRERAGSPT